MRTMVFLLLLFALLFAPLSELQAQGTDISSDQSYSFDRSTVPQWAKDLRRFDIIAFGTFPFTMIFTTIGYDIYLNSNSLTRPSNYHNDVLLIAAGASLTFALVDIIITVVKRSKEQSRLESIPAGNYEIEILPYGEPASEESDESPPN